MRHFIQMDIGGLPQRDFLKSIELLGTTVKPLIDRDSDQSLGTSEGLSGGETDRIHRPEAAEWVAALVMITTG